MNRIGVDTMGSANQLRYGPVESDADRDALLPVLVSSFNIKPRDMERYYDRVGAENFRVVRDGATIVGGLAIIRMGQFYGGHRVPMAGIAVVGIAPWLRGKGAARTLMCEAMRELRAEGFATSTLYPATQTLYRSAGYELAGSQYEIKLPLGAINMRTRERSVRPATPVDEPAIDALHRERAARHNGNLDRDRVMWERIRSPRGKKADGFVVTNGETIEGYVYFTQQNARHKPYSLRIVDQLAATPAAARQLLAFLAEHRSVGEEAMMMGSPSDPLLAVLLENVWKIELRMHWMLRVLDVKASLEARGWSSCASGELRFEIEDELLPANAGAWTLRVDKGKAAVTKGGEASLRLSVRALAPLYTGFMTARDLATIGWLEARNDEALALANDLFQSTSPWMSDGF
jgi:predicted acetyltransferase